MVWIILKLIKSSQIKDNKLKHKKFIPGVKIPIHSKEKLKDVNNTMLVLAWNFFDDIKKNNEGKRYIF